MNIKYQEDGQQFFMVHTQDAVRMEKKNCKVTIMSTEIGLYTKLDEELCWFSVWWVSRADGE